jgi:PPOX class probable F420-dependent enzyme
VARLATADAAGQPHVVPITFALSGGAIVFVVDEKPKRTHGTGLKRMRNILANPCVAIVVDHYDDDWTRLAYALILGRAEIIAAPGRAYAEALARLRARYPAYRRMALRPARNPVVRIRPLRIHLWEARAGHRGGGRRSSGR